MDSLSRIESGWCEKCGGFRPHQNGLCQRCLIDEARITGVEYRAKPDLELSLEERLERARRTNGWLS